MLALHEMMTRDVRDECRILTSKDGRFECCSLVFLHLVCHFHRRHPRSGTTESRKKVPKGEKNPEKNKKNKFLPDQSTNVARAVRSPEQNESVVEESNYP